MKLLIFNKIYDARYSNDGNTIGVCSYGLISLWDARNLSEPLQEIKGESKDFVYSIAFINNGKNIVSGFINSNLIVYNLDGSVADKIELPAIQSEKAEDPRNSVNL